MNTIPDDTWTSILDEMPPHDVMVLTFGGWCDGRIQKDYFSSSVGDWMCQPGDPTHWKLIDTK